MDLMDMEGSIVMDLTEYGAEGQIVLSMPRFTRKNELANALSKYISVKGERPVINDLEFGDLSILSTLAYVSKAPFYIGLDKGVKPFMDFMDSLDKTGSANADRLWKDIQENAGRIINGETHPLQ